MKYVSWTCWSNGTEAIITPVNPPMMNTTTKPSTQSKGTVSRGRPSHRVAIQQKIWIPLGMAIIMLAAVKKLSPSCGRPVANM